MYVRNLEMIFELFQHFGDLILYIRIDFSEVNAKAGEEIIRIINKQSFNSLTRLIMFNCKENVLKHLEKPFEMVKFLLFSTSRSENFISSDKKMSAFFPSISHLHIQYTKLGDWSFIDGIFQNLSWFEITLPKYDTKIEKKVLQFLEKNQQIDFLSICEGNLPFLKKVNEILPKIETLYLTYTVLNYLSDQFNEIHFRNVKDLMIDSYVMDKIPEKLIFDNLVQLSIISTFTDKWIEFIEKQVNKRLNMLKISSKILSKSHFFVIPVKLAHLLLVDIISESIFDANDIKQFIEMNKYLSSLECNFQMKSTEQKQLQRLFNNDDWTIEITTTSRGFNGVKFSLEKYGILFN